MPQGKDAECWVLSFVFLLASQCICQNRECVKRSAKSALSQPPVLRAGNCESAFFSLMLHQDIIYMPTILLQDLIYMIYIYMHTSKSFIQLGHKKQNILHMHSEKLHNAINGSMSFSQWISERKIQFCPVAPCSNDRVLFASMLQVFIASMNKRKQHFWLTEDFILSPSSTASSRAPYIKRYGMFCQGKHIVPLKNVVLLNPSTASTQILRATACFS